MDVAFERVIRKIPNVKRCNFFQWIDEVWGPCNTDVQTNMFKGQQKIFFCESFWTMVSTRAAISRARALLLARRCVCGQQRSVSVPSTSSVPCRGRGVDQDVLENFEHVVDGHDQDLLSSLSTLSYSFTSRRSYDLAIVSTPCRIRPRATGTTRLRIKSWLVQTLNSVSMLVPKMVWWLMEWVCRQLWALYPPAMDFSNYPYVDPVEVAMAVNPIL